MPLKRILCFGDSLTWGIVPGTRQRHPSDIRWPRVLAAQLDADVYEEALPGRTTAYEFPGRPYRNGLDALPMFLEQHAPLDTVILMLGTNDFFAQPNPCAEHVLFGLNQLASLVRAPQVEPGMPIPELVIVTPPLPRIVANSPYPFAEVTERIDQEAKRLPKMLQGFAKTHGFGYFDASGFETDAIDGIHLSGATTQKLGVALAGALGT